MNGNDPSRPKPEAPLLDEGVLHDLANPLTAILGNLQLVEDLLADTAPPAVMRRLAAGIDSAEELRAMIENLRDLMAPTQAIRRSPVDLSGLLMELVRDAVRRTPERPAPRFGLSAGGLGRVVGSEEHLRRVAGVLLGVASRIGSEVDVSVESRDASIEVRFTHRGKTMPPSLAGRVMEVDFSESQGAAGVKYDRARGLLFARRIAEAHGGRIAYDPLPDGGVFTLTLPRA